MYDKYFLMSEPDIEGYIRENLPEYFAADEKLVARKSVMETSIMCSDLPMRMEKA